MVQNMIPKSWRAMKLYFTTVYQEIWVGVALTGYIYYKISYGGKLHIIVFISCYFKH
ncbi:68MP protein, partial [Podargus strigoides]|nr:68MP protein [Podargus strigoides]